MHNKTELSSYLLESANPLSTGSDLSPLLDRTQNASHVLIGEATHGTKEFYEWRMEISKQLIVEQQFSFIAVEGDWPDCYKINQYVKGYLDPDISARDVLYSFNRWPTWMWANEEMIVFVEWLKNYNDGLEYERKVGFYGLDVYSLWESLRAVIEYLERVDPGAAEKAREVYRCFEPYGENANQYAMAAGYLSTSCEDEVIALLTQMRQDVPKYSNDEWEATFNAEQNAMVVADAEEYYRTLLRGDVQSWNFRDIHMAATLRRLMDFHGLKARGIVWAHNTHVGDARATDMVHEGLLNIGQIVREEQQDEKVVLIGFGTYEGMVIASREWDGSIDKMILPAAKTNTWEDVLHRVNTDNKFWVFDPLISPEELFEARGHRAVGVVYHPEIEVGNYVDTVLPDRYDVFIYIDKTSALHPLHLKEIPEKEPPETYPTGI